MLVFFETRGSHPNGVVQRRLFAHPFASYILSEHQALSPGSTAWHPQERKLNRAPMAWLGLMTLMVLELVLGIDNLVFKHGRQRPRQHDRTCVFRLSFALLMHLGLLASIF
jgi:hypothetical protein